MYSRLSITRSPPGVVICKLARPEKLNAFDNLMWAELETFFAEVTGDATVRVILVCGAGRAFTCGLDLAAIDAGDLGDEEDVARRGLRIRSKGAAWQRSFSNIASCGKPCVACVHGPCIGAGIEMISACDVRFCSEDAFFAMAKAAMLSWRYPCRTEHS